MMLVLSDISMAAIASEDIVADMANSLESVFVLSWGFMDWYHRTKRRCWVKMSLDIVIRIVVEVET